MRKRVGKGGKRAPTQRRAKFNALVRKTDNAYQSAIAAGYPPSTAHSKSGAMAQAVRSEYVGALRAHGCTAEFKARKTMRLFNARMPKWNPEKKKFVLFENADVQLRALQEVNRIEDEYPAVKEPGGGPPVTIVLDFAELNVAVKAGD